MSGSYRYASSSLHVPAAACRAPSTRSAAAVGATANTSLLILLLDDVGWGDFSPPLGDSPAHTPELLAMLASRNTVHFPRFYIGGSVCSPTRASILTGRSPTRDCVINVEQIALPLQAAESSLGRYAQRAGMRTFFAGCVLSTSAAPRIAMDIAFAARRPFRGLALPRLAQSCSGRNRTTSNRTSGRTSRSRSHSRSRSRSCSRSNNREAAATARRSRAGLLPRASSIRVPRSSSSHPSLLLLPASGTSAA